MKKSDLAEMPQSVREFVHYAVNVRGRSMLTALEYASDLRTFFRFIMQKKYPAAVKDVPFDNIAISDIDMEIIGKITLSDIYEFLTFCGSDLNNIASTRSRKVSTIRQYFNYLVSMEKIENNPAQKLSTPKKKKALPKYLTLDDSLKLLECIDGQFYERDYCIITLFLNCGLRLSELVALNMSSIRSDNSMVVTGKGNKQRVVYLNAACVSAINDYMTVRPVDGVKDKKALFISRQKNRISPKTVQYIVNKFIEKSGLADRGYSVHKLRHTAATLMYQHGNVDVLLIKEILGHENLGTTQIYTHVANEQIREAIDDNPLSTVKKTSKKHSESE